MAAGVVKRTLATNGWAMKRFRPSSQTLDFAVEIAKIRVCF
jgi:hypothetical protein